MNFRRLLLLLTVSSLLFSCSKDKDYSLDNFWVTSATIYTDDVQPYLIVTDSGDKLFPSISNIDYKPTNQQRVWVSYTILNDTNGEFDFYVRVNNVSEILTKDIIKLTDSNKDSIGNDPINIENLWFTDNYLTIQFLYGGGGAVHFVNLVKNVDSLYTDDGKPILEFRHNRNHDLYNNALRGWSSFNMKSLEKQEADSVVFVLKAKSIKEDAPFRKELIYRYGIDE